MSELEKLNRLRHIMCQQHSMRTRHHSYGENYFPNAGLNISTSSGRGRYIEYSGDRTLSDNPIKPSEAFDESRSGIKNRQKATRELDLFVAGLETPELQDEFFAAVSKITKKADQIRTAAQRVRKAKNPQGVEASRLKERWVGNSLFELELSGYENDKDTAKALFAEARDIARELNLHARLGMPYDEWNLPSYHQVNDLYHQQKRAASNQPNSEIG